MFKKFSIALLGLCGLVVMLGPLAVLNAHLDRFLVRLRSRVEAAYVARQPWPLRWLHLTPVVGHLVRWWTHVPTVYQ